MNWFTVFLATLSLLVHHSYSTEPPARHLVDEASLLGFGLGIARGGVPQARIAVYKVCWSENDCGEDDVIRAFDDAIAVGVDLISISLGRSISVPYFESSIAIGYFHAMQNGMLTSSSAGNRGAGLFSVANDAPWLVTVAASTINRKFSTQVLLGNQMLFELYYISSSYLIISDDWLLRNRLCNTANSLDQNVVRGKIVICEEDIAGTAALVEARASGTIMLVPYQYDHSSIYPLPASVIELEPNGISPILSYMNSTSIFLQPDLAAPGVHILAAWPSTISRSSVAGDSRVTTFKILSGTSVACGAAAYVKSFHASWSPAAIKYALMTTAFSMDVNEANDQNGLAYGAGNVNPSKAIEFMIQTYWIT
ncbi:hypothetical protein ACH5RR_016291 [Cinchona calisaya]|uniref:Peptidase S8/S53 domain-containing protein n=1 Tax=Cinchona calisaya TaxID=153742 RepID=A0ABD2ZZ76_9GENT